VSGFGEWLREWFWKFVTSSYSLEGPQIERFLENASNLVESWFLNIILEKFVTLCVMGLEMDWLNYLYMG
jgi:hypothetical protein